MQTDLIKAFGVGLTGEKLSTVIRTSRLTEQWAEALGRAGHPKTLQQQKEHRLIEVLRWRKEQGLPLNIAAVRKETSIEFLKKLEEVFGEQITSEAYVQRTLKAFESWENALAKIEIQIENVRVRQSYLKPDQIIKVLQMLQLLNLNTTANFAKNNKEIKISKLIKQVTGQKVMLSQVYRAALEIKVWNDWLKESRLTDVQIQNLIKELYKDGIDIQKVKQSGVKLAQAEEAIRVIQFLFENNVSLNGKSIQNDRTSETANLIKQVIGRSLTGAAFYNKLIEADLSWNKLLSKSGLDPRTIMKTGFGLTLEEGIQIIKALHEKGIYLNAKRLRQDTTPETANLIEQVTGRKQTGAAFFRMVVRNKWSWNEMLQEAGLDPRKIMLTGYGVTKTEGALVLIHLYQNGVPLNVRSIKTDYSENTALLIGEITGRKQTGSAFYKWQRN